ncbi:MAG: hypothetical protein H8E46_09885 [FCB group bacterium]|nr:hypothetical protein [FCB group bacterium]
MIRRIAILAVFAFTLKTQFIPVNSLMFTPADLQDGSIPRPVWLADSAADSDNDKPGLIRFAKPVLITAAAAGITYFLYAARSR